MTVGAPKPDRVTALIAFSVILLFLTPRRIA
jgi:hypothetical protein